MEKLKILIVENDEDEQIFMRRGFMATGLFQIMEILDNGDQVIPTIQNSPAGPPDVVLSDLNLYGKDGFEILTDIKSSPGLSHIPVVIVSSASTQSMIEKSKELGACLYKLKPDNFTEYDQFARYLYEELSKERVIKN